MGGFAQVSAGPVGGGPANAGYITRTSAAEVGEAVYHNAPEDVREATTWNETRIRMRSWAEQVKAEEIARHGNRAGQPRTHYRAVVSYDEEVPTEAVREDVQEILEEEFPEAQAVAVVHQDTDNSHAHIWMSARKQDGSKVHISNQDLKDLHATVDEVYERRMNVRSRNVEKIEETRQFKAKYAELEAAGASEEELASYVEANRPERAQPAGSEVYREREKRLAGQGLAEEAERRVEQTQAQRAGEVEDLISEANERIEHSHAVRKLKQSQRQQRGSDRTERETSEGREATESGEREADRGGEKGPERRSGGPSKRSEKATGQREHEHDDGEKKEQEDQREAGRDRVIGGDGDSAGDLDSDSDRRGGSVDSEGRDPSEVGGRGGVDFGELPSGADGARQRDRRGVKALVEDLAQRDVTDEVESEAEDAADHLHRLHKAHLERLWEEFDEDEKAVIDIADALRDRKKAGTQDEYEALSKDQKRVVRHLQVSTWHDKERNIETAAEAMSGFSEGERSELKSALPKKARDAYKEALKRAQKKQDQSKSKDSKSDSKSRDRGRSRGGRR